MIPKSVIIKKEGTVLYWRNDSFHISVEEAGAVAQEVLKGASSPQITSLLVDNRQASGAWSPEVNEVWMKLMENLAPHIQKSATIASVVTAMQINRISKHAGTDKVIRAFSDLDEALQFIGVKSLSILT